MDYLVKPFALAELDARIRAQLRAARQTPATTLRRAGLTLDLLSRRVTHEGYPVRLTTTEFDLLAYFMQNPGQVLSRQQIHRAVWGSRRSGHQQRGRGRGLQWPQADRPGPRAGADHHASLARLPVRGSRLIARSSLRWRLVAWVTGVMLVVCAIVFVVVYQQTGSQLRSRVDADFRADVRQLSDVVRTLQASSCRGCSPGCAALLRLLHQQLLAAVRGRPGAGDGQQPSRGARRQPARQPRKRRRAAARERGRATAAVRAIRPHAPGRFRTRER